MNKFIIFLLISICPAVCSMARKKPTQAEAKKEQKATVSKGLFSVTKEKDDWFFIINDSILERPFLAITRYVTTPVGSGKYGGEMANSQVLYWLKQDNSLVLKSMMYSASADSLSDIYKAVRTSTEDPIVAMLKIESTVKSDHKVKVTDLFKGDNTVLSLSTGSKNTFNLAGIRNDLSYIEDIRTYPINTEVVTVKTFMSKPGSGTQAGRETGVVTLKLNTSLILLPKEPMRYRTFDPRVGYFTDSHSEFSDAQHQVKEKRIAVRWRLEPKDEEAYKRGELVEPKKQIVYYIDPATPKKWRKYLIQGVEDWNVAFEQAGFKNAITAKEWPEDSTGMSLEDARYSVIRYLASNIPNAYGPQIHDPRSGEILETHIGWYHNVMKLVHDWYFVQAGAIDPRARTMQFDDELMGQLIRFVSSHEVGHTLGLRHNMGASSATPVEKLRDKEWVEKHGHTASIMDYARFNYVAQPEDNISESGIFPRINDYDLWAIKWGYTYFPDAFDEYTERIALNKMTVKQLAQGQRYWFGGEGYDNDPKAQTEDLGDDAMKASDYGIQNLKRLIPRLDNYAYQEGDMGDNLNQLYTAITGQMRRYIKHVSNNIGGCYHNYKSAEQSGDVYTVMDKQTQKRAMEWLKDNVIIKPEWLLSPSYINRLSPIPETLIRPMANDVVDNLCSASKFNNISLLYRDSKCYSPEEYTNDLYNMLFGNLQGRRLTGWERYYQKRAVNNLINAMNSSNLYDGHSEVTAFLMKLHTRLKQATAGDDLTKAHYSDLARRISLSLEGK